MLELYTSSCSCPFFHWYLRNYVKTYDWNSPELWQVNGKVYYRHFSNCYNLSFYVEYYPFNWLEKVLVMLQFWTQVLSQYNYVYHKNYIYTHIHIFNYLPLFDHLFINKTFQLNSSLNKTSIFPIDYLSTTWSSDIR